MGRCYVHFAFVFTLIREEFLLAELLPGALHNSHDINHAIVKNNN